MAALPLCAVLLLLLSSQGTASPLRVLGAEGRQLEANSRLDTPCNEELGETTISESAFMKIVSVKDQPDQLAKVFTSAAGDADIVAQHELLVTKLAGLAISSDRNANGQTTMFMDKAQGQSALAWLSANMGKGVGEKGVKTKLKYAVLAAVSELHAKHIVHADLHSCNVFVHGPPGEPKVTLIDFGESVLVCGGGVDHPDVRRDGQAMQGGILDKVPEEKDTWDNKLRLAKETPAVSEAKDAGLTDAYAVDHYQLKYRKLEHGPCLFDQIDAAKPPIPQVPQALAPCPVKPAKTRKFKKRPCGIDLGSQSGCDPVG